MSLYSILEKTPEKRRMEYTPFVVFMAFSIESYLNNIGSRVVDYWDNIERITWNNKIEILHSIAQRKPEWGREPLQFIKELFTIRDKLAHGKPEKIEGDIYPTIEDAHTALSKFDPEPGWYSKIDREWIIRAKDKYHEAMVYLGNLHGFHESDYLLLSSGGYDPAE